jgi:vacuolar-type H+-ATPase subunit E/Vma4
MIISAENELIEKIAKLLDEYLEIQVDDLTNIDNMVQLEKKEAKLTQQLQNNLDEINGGSK